MKAYGDSDFYEGGGSRKQLTKNKIRDMLSSEKLELLNDDMLIEQGGLLAESGDPLGFIVLAYRRLTCLKSDKESPAIARRLTDIALEMIGNPGHETFEDFRLAMVLDAYLLKLERNKVRLQEVIKQLRTSCPLDPYIANVIERCRKK